MKINLTINETLNREIRSYAERLSLPFSGALLRRIRLGLERPTTIRWENGLKVFDIPRSRRPVTLKQVKKLQAND